MSDEPRPLIWHALLADAAKHMAWLETTLAEALSIIRSAQTNTVFETAKAFIEKVEGK